MIKNAKFLGYCNKTVPTVPEISLESVLKNATHLSLSIEKKPQMVN